LRALFLHVISLNNEIADPKSLLPSVYWSCQFIARASNVSLKHWQQMGGINIDENILIDKTIHKAINSKSSVLKRYVADIGKSWPVLIVCGGLLPLFLSVIWLLLIRYFVVATPWITVVVFNALVISVTMFFYIKGMVHFCMS
jgi:choline transporter-like protein 2/4/5